MGDFNLPYVNWRTEYVQPCRNVFCFLRHFSVTHILTQLDETSIYRGVCFRTWFSHQLHLLRWLLMRKSLFLRIGTTLLSQFLLLTFNLNGLCLNNDNNILDYHKYDFNAVFDDLQSIKHPTLYEAYFNNFCALVSVTIKRPPPHNQESTFFCLFQVWFSEDQHMIVNFKNCS